MIDRPVMCVGALAGAIAAPIDIARAMPSGPLRQSVGAQWTPAQLPPIHPPSHADLADPKGFGNYLTEDAYGRLQEAGISIADDARGELQQVIGRSVEAAFRSQAGEIRKGNTLDALPIEVRRVIVLRNFNTFVDVLIIVAWNEGKRLTKEVVNRVQGFLCPLYPICTG
jgi:hypothetical protein